MFAAAPQVCIFTVLSSSSFQEVLYYEVYEASHGGGGALALTGMVSLLLAAPAKQASAQYGYGSGGHWNCYFTTQGAYDAVATGPDGIPHPGHTDMSGPWPPGNGYAYCGAGPGIGVSALYAYNGNVQISAHLKCVWVANYPGYSSGPPPSKLSIRYVATAGWGAGSATSGQDIILMSHSATDGFKDDETLSGNYNDISQGSHLKTYNSSSGVVEDDVSLQTNVAFYAPGGANGSFGVYVTAYQDDHGAMISSSLDPTFYKGADPLGRPIQVANVCDPNNPSIMHGDTVVPPPDPFPAPGVQQGMSVGYFGWPLGSWSQDSQYTWTSKYGTPGSYFGTFNGYASGSNIVFGTTYTAGTHPSAGDVDKVHLRLDDGPLGFGVTADANYLLTFHDVFEGWTRDTPVGHPMPDQPTPEAQGEWAEYIVMNNGGSQNLSQTYSLQNTLTMSVSGTIGEQGGITFSGEVVSIAFSKNESITIGSQYSSAATSSTTAVCPPHKKLYIYYGIRWQQRHGKTDNYDTHGFNSVVPWNATVPSHGPDGGLSIAWATCERDLSQ